MTFSRNFNDDRKLLVEEVPAVCVDVIVYVQGAALQSVCLNKRQFLSDVSV